MGKCTIDLITGFLASGKTSLMQSVLNKVSPREEIVVVQCENGVENLNPESFIKKRITLKEFKSNEELTEERILRLIRFYSPERIIIECNGVDDIKNLTDTLSSKTLKPYVRLGITANIVDVTTFNMFLKNIPSMIMPNLQNSNLIILNRCDNIPKETVKEYVTMIETLNLYAHIITCGAKEELDEILYKSTIVNRLLG